MARRQLAPVMWFTPYVRSLAPCPPDTQLRLATHETHSWKMPEPRVRTAKGQWMVIAGLLLVAMLAGCAHKPTPMAEWTCAGWRTLEDGRNECMQVEARR